MREPEILRLLQGSYHCKPVVDVGGVDEGEILFALDGDGLVAVKYHSRHQARAYRVPDGDVAMIIQSRSVGKRAYQGGSTIHNGVAWVDLLGETQRR